MLQLAWVEAILHTYRHIYMQIRTIRYVTALARTDLDPERWNQCWVSAVVIQSFLQPQQQMVTEADCSPEKCRVFMQAGVFETVGSASDASSTSWLLVSGYKRHCITLSSSKTRDVEGCTHPDKMTLF